MIANDLALLPILLGATAEQKERLLRPFTERLQVRLASGSPSRAPARTWRACAHHARRDGDHYVVNGQKRSSPTASTPTSTRSSAPPTRRKKHKGITCLVVEGRPEGLTVGKHENKMGQRASNTVTLTFEDVRVPVANRIGAGGRGLRDRHGHPRQLPPAHRHVRRSASPAPRWSTRSTTPASASSSASPSPSSRPFSSCSPTWPPNIEAARLLTYQSAWLLDQRREEHPRLELRQVASPPTWR